MILKLNYLGMISEAIGKEKEVLDFSQKTIKELNEFLHRKYAELIKLNYNFAVNRTMVKQDEILQENDEIALLPPFAGG